MPRLRVYGQCFPDPVSLCLAPSPCTRLSRAPSTTSESDFHRRVCLPQKGSFGRHTRSISARSRRRWISQVPDASVSGHAVLSDPAAVSGSHRHYRLPTVAFQIFDPVGLRTSTHEAQSLHSHYGLPIALPTLSACRYLHSPKARFPVGWLAPCRCGNCTRWKRQAWPGAPK